MSIGLSLYRILQSHKQNQAKQDYDLWLSNHNELLLRERQENNRKIADQIETFNSNLKIRVKRLECLGNLYGIANGMLSFQKFQHDSIISKNYLRKAVSLGVEAMQPFHHLNAAHGNYAIKIELVLAFYMFVFHRLNSKYQSLGVVVDLGMVNVISGWLLNHIGYFTAAGIRATNTHISLFECLSDEQKKTLLAKKDHEGFLLNRYCGSDHNRSVAYLTRLISTQVMHSGLHTNYLEEDSHWVSQLIMGSNVRLDAFLKSYVGEDEKRLANALSFFDDFENKPDIENVLDHQPIWTCVYSMLAIMEKERPEYLSWLVDNFSAISNRQCQAPSYWSVEHVFTINKLFGFFQNHSVESELFYALRQVGIYNSCKVSSLSSRTEHERLDPIHLIGSDFPELTRYIDDAFRAHNFGGELGQVFQLESK